MNTSTEEPTTPARIEQLVEFREGRYFATVWFVEGPAMDYLAALFRDPDSPWRLCWRFRYYADAQAHAHHPQDVKSTHGAECPRDFDQAKAGEALEQAAQQAARAWRTNVVRVELASSDAGECMKKLAAMPWARPRVS